MNREELRKAQNSQPAEVLANLGELINSGAVTVARDLSTVCFSVRGADVGITTPVQTHASLQENHTLKIYV